MDIHLTLSPDRFNQIQSTLQAGKMKPMLCQCGEDHVCVCTIDSDGETPELDECSGCGRYVPWCYFPDVDVNICAHCTLTGQSLISAVLGAIT